MTNKYQIFLISDSTGETLDRIFLALQSQFANFDYDKKEFVFIRTQQQIEKIINECKNKDNSIILYTIVDTKLAKFLSEQSEKNDIPCFGVLGNLILFCHECPQINKSLELLEQIGGIDANEDLRPLGYHLASLPVDVRIGKLLIFGALLRCVNPMLSIAAVLSTRSPFLNLQNRDPDERHSIELQRKEISRKCGKSDHMVFAKTFTLFAAAKDKRAFCTQLGLSIDGMNNVRQLRKEYARDLTSIGFLPGGSSNPTLNVNADSIRMVSAALCAGMYSNVLHVIRPTQKYHETAEGSVAALGKAQELQFYMWPDQEPAPEHAHRANAYDPLWWRGERAMERLPPRGQPTLETTHRRAPRRRHRLAPRRRRCA